MVLVFSNLTSDTRVKRQIDFIKDDYDVTVASFDAENPNGYTFSKLNQTNLSFFKKILIAVTLLFGLNKIGYKLLHPYDSLVEKLSHIKFDVVIANDVETLPLAFGFKTKVLLDAHEYAPRHFEDKLWWRIFFKGLNSSLCNHYIPKVERMTTIGHGLADEYRSNFGIQPLVISNASKYHELKPTQPQYNQIRLVHVGIANPSRKIELMIEMMEHLDYRFSLDMLLVTSVFASPKTKKYINNLTKKIKGDQRIKILPPVESHKLVEFINQYDVGVFLIPPVNFNYANTMPNKLFEYIQGRLAIAIGPSPEMASVVNDYAIGVVCENFDPKRLASKLNQLTPQELFRYKSNTQKAATELCAEHNKVLFNNLLKDIL